MIVFWLLSFALAQDISDEELTIEEKPMVEKQETPIKEKKKRKKPTPLPKYEFGLGYIYGDLPDYPGANESTIRAFPIPYFVYRGDVLQAEQGGLRTRFLRGAYYEYDFSFAGAFPANSSDNDARENMDDLGWMFEVGPQLKLFLYKSSLQNWTLRLPIRAVFSLDDGDVHGRGYSLSPNLQVSFPSFPFKRNVLSIGFTTDFATQKTHQYFYDVKQKFVTADRTEYTSDAGLLGSSIDISLITSWQKFSLYVGAGVNFYGDAENKHSPLHLDNQTSSVSAGFIWSFYQSKQQGFR
jgi:MipA family protein